MQASKDQPSERGAPSTLIYAPASYAQPIDPGKIFSRARPLELELGSGDGGFLAAWAALHPSRNFLGVERLLGRLRKLDRKGLRAGLTNLRLIRIEAGYFLRYLLPTASIAVIHVYFPDPWPKRRHWKHRLVNPDFVSATARVLHRPGRIYLRTDHHPYFEQMTRLFQADPRFGEVETPGELLVLETEFERDFRARGLVVLRAAYERLEVAGAPS